MIRLVRRLGVLGLAFTLAACSDSTTPLPDGPALQLSVVSPQAVSQAELDALGEAFDRVDAYDVTILDTRTLDVLASASLTITAGGTQHTLDVPVPEVAFGRPVTIMLVAFDGGVELYRSVFETTLGSQAGVVSVNLPIRYTGPGIRGTITDAAGDGVGGVSVNLFVGQSIIDAVSTEDDGTYLFLDVDAGNYTVVPTPPQNVPYICPGARDVSIGGTDDAVVADFATSDDQCGVSVLVLSGGDVDDTGVIAQTLSANTALAVSTFFHVNTLPSLDFLNQHDVILLLMNGLFDESSALGTRVRDYVAAGGNVVLASFYWQGRSDSGLGSTGWGTLESVDPFLSLGGATYEADVMDTVLGHPLTNNVNTLASTAGFRGGVSARAETTVLATWSDGSPLIGYRILGGGQRIVGVSLFPGGGATGDVDQLWDNAVSWTGAAGGPS